MNSLLKYQLPIIVFTAGAVVMVFELAGSRVLAPYFGTSMFVWTSLIGIILGSLSIGYWLGGILSDYTPNKKILARILLISAVSIFVVTLLKDIVLILLQKFGDIRIASAIASTILFAPTSILLGMVSPYAVKLTMTDLAYSGRTVGNLYALSTLGSIFGTFFAGFFLIPLLGSTNILFTLSAILTLLSLLAYISKTHMHGRIFFGFLIIPMTIVFFPNFGTMVEAETSYSRIFMYDEYHRQNHRPIRYMRINNERSSAMYLDGDDLVYPYTNYYDLARHFMPDMKTSLMIGGAAYSYPKYFLQTYASATIDVVEIDPGVTKLAKKYFNLTDNPRLKIFHEDGRTFLNKNTTRYDVIFVDAFSSSNPPAHLTTREAVQKMHESTSADGVVLVNIISSIKGPKSAFLRAEYATFQEVFPHVYLFPVHDQDNVTLRQNIMLVALKDTTSLSFEGDNEEITNMLEHALQNYTQPSVPILTDDHAPVEYYMRKVF